MKKLLCILISTGLVTLSSLAQVATYTFSQATGTFDTLANGKVIGSATTAAGTYFTDSTATAGSTTVTTGIGLPIGFTFKFNGTNFDVFGVNVNGWIAFGQSSLSPASVNLNCNNAPNTPISSPSTAAAILQNKVSAFGRTWVPQATSKLSYKTVGTAPNRILIVEWRGFRRSTTATGESINFQIKLFETSNIVNIVYGTVTYAGTGSTAQVGLRGQANTDFNNRSTTTNWSASTAGAQNTSAMAISGTVYPSSGLTFVFTPLAIPNLDAGITAVNTPNIAVPIGNNDISVTIKNFGSDSLKSANIAWAVNGVLQTPYIFNHVGLPYNTTSGPITLGSYNFTAIGLYTIRAWTTLPNGLADTINGNDTTFKLVYVPAYANIPFMESFDSAWVNKFSTHDVPSLYWINSPYTGSSSWRRDDDGATANWTLGTTGAYTPAGSNSTSHSARFHTAGANGGTGTMDVFLNFSTNGMKVLKFWHINTVGTDSVYVSLSTNGGSTFNLIQKFAVATVWTQRQVFLGVSNSPNSVVRIAAKGNVPGNTDIGIDEVQVSILPANDAGLTSIDIPAVVPKGSNPIAVTIKNFGADSLKSATIKWSVEGLIQPNYLYSNQPGLATNISDGPVNIGNYNFATTGFYTIKAWTSFPNLSIDGNNSNDTLTKTVYAQPYASIPFFENFDSLWVNKNDTSDVPNAFWTNNPSFGNSSWRRENDTLSGNWTQGWSGAYLPTGADSSLHSARFHSSVAAFNANGVMDLYIDLSPIGTKLLDFWYINTSGNDSLSVYLSTNGGTTFSFLKKLTIEANWTRNLINIGYSSSANCIIRFRAVSDNGQTDIGLDQMQVYLLPANDMAAVKWVAPLSGCNLSNAESIVVKITNNGTAPQSNIPVTYSINYGPIVSETYFGIVNPGDTITYTFNTKANFTGLGNYFCNFTLKNPGDAIAMNDSVYANIYSVMTISGNPFKDSLEAGNKHYKLINGSNSSVSLLPAVGNNGTSGFDMTGGAAGTWPNSTSNSTTAKQAFSYTDHIARIQSCPVDASAYPANQLYLNFDLKMTHSSSGNKYSYFMVLVNGTDTISDITGTKFFNAVTGNNDPFTAKYFNLGAYAGQTFTMEFVSSCKYNDANQSPADHVFIDNIALYVPPVINNLGNDTSICQGSSVTFDAGAGVGYTYLWTRLPAGDTVGNTRTITVNTSGTYQVAVTNSQGYTAADAVKVTVIAIPAANAGTDITIASGTTTTLHGTVTGFGAFSYSWSPADSLVNANLQNPVTIPLQATTVFTLYATNLAAGCVGTDQVIVYVTGGPLSVNALVNPDTICAGNLVSFGVLPSGGTGTYSYQWTSVPSGFSSNVNNPTDHPQVNTLYNLMISDGTDTAYSSVSVFVYPLPVVYLGNDTTLCTTNTITLNPGLASSYLWSTGATTQSIVVDSTFAVIGIATVWVEVTNANGCKKRDTISITFVSCSGISEYNNSATMAIYPNPTNGLTNILINGLNTNVNLEVYNLQGQLMYSTIVAGNVSTTLDLTLLPKGVYVVRLQNEQNNHFRKLIIQ